MYHLAPLVGTLLYLSYPWNNKYFIIAHNAALQIFSTWMCISLGNAIWNKGFHVKTNFYLADPHINTLVFYFYLSKYYEYLDTFIIYAKGKQPIFLQKYHHVGAVVCWHYAWIYKVDSVIWASFFNSFVHSIMYLYYLLNVLGIKLPEVKPYITWMQMTQFSSAFLCLYFWYPIESYTNKIIMSIFILYNSGLMVLFSLFMYNTYWCKSQPSMREPHRIARG